MPIRHSIATLLIAGLVLTGCASLPTGQGRDAVAEALVDRHGSAVVLADPADTALDADLAARLSRPLSPEAAVEIAWRHSPPVKAALAELGIAAGDAFEAARPRNPQLSASRMGGGEHSLGLAIVLSDLLWLPARQRAGAAQWREAIAHAAEALIDEAAAVREAYYAHLGALQIADMREAVAEAAELSAELAQRFHAAGNISALQLAREQAAASMARGVAARARVARLETRMALAERLGLAGRSNAWRLPERLPLPPASDPGIDELLALAASQRLDLASARAAIEARGEALAITRRLRGMGEIELGVEREREGDERKTGPHLALELPLFDRGEGKLARSEGEYQRAVQAAAAIELAIQREVRTGLARLSTLREIAATYRDALIPQNEAIVARQQERYNFMLIGVFELLAAKQQEYDAYQGYLEAIRDYWLAHSALTLAVGGRLPGGAEAGGSAPALEDLLQPEGASGHGHHDHGSTP